MTTPDTPGPADPAGPQQDEGPVQQAQTIPVQEFARGTVSGDYAGRLAYAGERPVNSLAKTIDAPTLAQELRDRIASDKARTAKMEAALNALETNPVIEVALTGLALLRGDRY